MLQKQLAEMAERIETLMDEKDEIEKELRVSELTLMQEQTKNQQLMGGNEQVKVSEVVYCQIIEPEIGRQHLCDLYDI